jgi:hypothetical protein
VNGIDTYTSACCITNVGKQYSQSKQPCLSKGGTEFLIFVLPYKSKAICQLIIVVIDKLSTFFMTELTFFLLHYISNYSMLKIQSILLTEIRCDLYRKLFCATVNILRGFLQIQSSVIFTTDFTCNCCEIFILDNIRGESMVRLFFFTCIVFFLFYLHTAEHICITGYEISFVN